MPSVELKSIDRLKAQDRLLTDAGVLIKAGRCIDDKSIQMLGRHKNLYVPTLGFTYEEQQKLKSEESSDKFIQSFLSSRRTRLEDYKQRLLEKVKTIYVPFSEDDHIFTARGKKKQITEGVLLEPRPSPLYRDDIQAGSESVINQNDLRFLDEILTRIYELFEKMNARCEENKGKKKIIPRLRLRSIRLHSYYDNGKLSTIGDAFANQAVDVAVQFLIVMMNINKQRILRGFPKSDDRFDPDKSYTETQQYYYEPAFIIQAALGILLHNLGFLHQGIHQVVSARPPLDPESKKDQKRIRALQRSYYVVKHLVSQRDDISALSKMMVSLQHDYPDGTGYPAPNENRFVHEFVRLFQIIRFYDEMTNPCLSRNVYSRMDVIEYIKRNSGKYNYSKEAYEPQPRFDGYLVDEFLSLLSPYELGEKVYLYPEGKRSTHYFVGRVYAYQDSSVPLLSILRDERQNKQYRYGSMLFNLEKSEAYIVQNKKITKRMQIEWIGKLRIFDATVSPAPITEWQDVLYGRTRPLSRKIRNK